ncbi:MAG: hypothetical protein QOJ01_109 [Solirubrobacterales bacterium]|jgi:hypothetical protein|nr:hypothetical protein [Solirubrobacterales bacterium]
MHGLWPIVFLAVVLKIPVGFLLYTVYWAIKATPEVEEAPETDGGHGFRRFRREPKRPRGPRRGPHAPDAVRVPSCPPGGRRRVLGPPATVRAGMAHARGAAEGER